MATTAWRTAGTTASVDRGAFNPVWSNPSNVGVSDNVRAISALGDTETSDFLRLTDFGFTTGDIPTGSTIVGVEYEIERRSDTPSSARSETIQLRVTAGAVGSNKAEGSGAWSTSDTTVAYGGAADTWAAGLTDTQARHADTGLDFAAKDLGSGTGIQVQVDFVRLRYHYTPPSSPISATANITLANATVVATATAEVKATASITLADATIDAEGVVGAAPVSATANITTADATIDATAAVEIMASATITLDDATIGADATVEVKATANITLANATVFGSAIVVTPPPPGGLALDAAGPAALSIEWLLDCDTVHVGTRDEVYDGTVYAYGITNGASLAVQRRSTEVFWGYQERADTTVEGTLGLWGKEGMFCRLRRRDWLSDVTIEEFTGVVEQVTLEAGKEIARLINLDLSALDTKIPTLLVTADAVIGNTGPDLGRAKRKVIGQVEKLPLLHVRQDPGAAQFWYHGSLDTGYTVSRVYRDRGGFFKGQYQELAGGEFAVSTSLVTGETIVRTFVSQQNGAGGGQFHTLFADVVPTHADRVAERNPVRAVRWCLEHLGETVDDAVFDAAELDIPVGLVVDGVIGLDGQEAAKEIIRLLLQVRGMRLGYGASGWTIAVDKALLSAAMPLQGGTPGVDPTILTAGRRLRPANRERVSLLKLRGGLDLPTGEYKLPAADRVVNVGIGAPKSIDHPYLRSPGAIDMTACYLAKRQFDFEDQIEGAEVNEDGRVISEGHGIIVLHPLLQIAVATAYQVLGVDKGTGRHRLHLCLYTETRFAYTPLTLPVVPIIDQTVQPPTVTSFTVVGTPTVETASDGRRVTVFILQVVLPAVPSITGARVDLRRTGTTDYGEAQPVTGTGTKLVRVTVAPGLNWDFRVVALGAMESTPMFLNNQLAPGGLAPSAPGTPVVSDKKLTVVTFLWSASIDPTTRGYNWDLRTAANGGGTSLKNGYVEGSTFTMDASSVGYGTARHFRVQAVGFNGLTSVFTSSVSVTFVQAQTGDYAPLSVTSSIIAALAVLEDKINDLAVTTAKRREVTVQSFAYSVGAGVGTSVGILHTHGLGKMPTGMQAFPSNLSVTITPNTMTTFTVNLNVINLTPGAQSGTAALHFW